MNNGTCCWKNFFTIFPDFLFSRSRKLLENFKTFSRIQDSVQTHPVTYTIPSREPKVWSSIGPVPEVGVEPLFRVQFKLSEVSWMKPHISFWKSQTIKKTYLLKLIEVNKSIRWLIFQLPISWLNYIIHYDSFVLEWVSPIIVQIKQWMSMNLAQKY